MSASALECVNDAVGIRIVCADEIASIDFSMQTIRDLIQEAE